MNLEVVKKLKIVYLLFWVEEVLKIAAALRSCRAAGERTWMNHFTCSTSTHFERAKLVFTIHNRQKNQKGRDTRRDCDSPNLNLKRQKVKEFISCLKLHESPLTDWYGCFFRCSRLLRGEPEHAAAGAAHDEGALQGAGGQDRRAGGRQLAPQGGQVCEKMFQHFCAKLRTRQCLSRVK